MVESNSELLLSGKFDFDPKEILNKFLLFDLKKTSKDISFNTRKITRQKRYILC